MAKKKALEDIIGSLQHCQAILTAYLKAGYPIIMFNTPEEERAEKDIFASMIKLKRKTLIWSLTRGIEDLVDGSNNNPSVMDPVEALEFIKGENFQNGGGHIFVFRDLHEHFEIPIVRRHIRDIAREFKMHQNHLIILGPSNQIPAGLDHDVAVVEFKLPNRNQIAHVLDNLSERNEKIKKVVDDFERDRMIQAALGLTSNETENAFAKALIEYAASLSLASDDIENMSAKELKELIKHASANGTRSVSELVMSEKANIVKKNGILEYYDADVQYVDVGGLDILKKWLHERAGAFSKEAREFGLPSPRGILLVGPPGCGKSLTAKAASGILKVPLIRFDIGRVFGGLVGQSEQNMRTAIQTIEAIGACVIWIDEMEKAFAGMASSGNTDSGVTARVFGNFITWMQEKKTPSFIISTVNKHDSLPSEMLRKGRFDEIFYVGLPELEERKEIFKIHIAKSSRPNFTRSPDDFNLGKLAEMTDKFSGAEIAECVSSSLFRAFADNKSKLTMEHIISVIDETTPLSKSRAEQLQSMEKWAKTYARWASDADNSQTKKKGQRVIEMD